MPFKSKAQIAKMGDLKKQGKITQEKFDQWMNETPNPSALPERVGQGKVRKVKKI